jgi:hypothetical protein
VFLGDDAGRILEQTLSDNENSLFDSDADSSIIEDLPIHEAIAIDGSEKEGRKTVTVCKIQQQVLCKVGLVLQHLHGRTGRKKQFILQHVDPLLSGDSVPMLGNGHNTHVQQRRAVFYVVHAEAT